MSFLKSIWKGNSKHKKLCEEWALTNTKEFKSAENSDDGAPFLVKYLGSTLVETPSSEKATAEAIKTIISMAKASGRKLARVALSVSLRGISVVELATEATLLQVSIYRISYCSADAAHNHVFAFITTNADETLECHAFLCPKRKIAQSVTLTVARSFNTVYELYQVSEVASRANRNRSQDFSGFCSKLEAEARQQKLHAAAPDSKSLLIDLNAVDEPLGHQALNDSNTSWVSFDNDDERSESVNNSFASGRLQQSLAFSPQQHLTLLSNRGPNGPNGTNVWGDMTQLL